MARKILLSYLVRVLIADDDRELANAVASYVRYCNADVVATVTTGGVDVIRNVDRFHPDIILMDIMMPRLNGLTVCHHILSRHPNTKIVLFSGKLDAQHPYVTGSGAAAFIAKPVKLAELRHVLEDVVRSTKETQPDELKEEVAAPAEAA